MGDKTITYGNRRQFRRQSPYPKTLRMTPHPLPFSAYVKLSCHTTVVDLSGLCILDKLLAHFFKHILLWESNLACLIVSSLPSLTQIFFWFSNEAQVGVLYETEALLLLVEGYKTKEGYFHLSSWLVTVFYATESPEWFLPRRDWSQELALFLAWTAAAGRLLSSLARQAGRQAGFY